MVATVDEFWWGRHSRCGGALPEQDVRWGRMATKLRMWQVFEFHLYN